MVERRMEVGMEREMGGVCRGREAGVVERDWVRKEKVGAVVGGIGVEREGCGREECGRYRCGEGKWMWWRGEWELCGGKVDVIGVERESGCDWEVGVEMEVGALTESGYGLEVGVDREVGV